jgi:hypothetical protein
MDVCMESNKYLKVFRARFSDFTDRGIFHAVNNLDKPNKNDNLAVEARKIIGKSFIY